jgi:hypothetical protein
VLRQFRVKWKYGQNAKRFFRAGFVLRQQRYLIAHSKQARRDRIKARFEVIAVVLGAGQNV